MDTFSNISPEVGTQLLEILGVSSLDLQTPEVFAKYEYIAKYFSKFQDAPAVARMVSRSTPTKEKLAKVYEYVSLRKELDILRESLKNIPSSDTITGDTEENNSARMELQTKESNILNEIQRYE